MDYLIAYDIEDNKARSKLYDRLKDFDLKPIQKSVFFGSLSRAQKLEVKGIIAKFCSNTDKAIITAINFDFADTIGYEKSDFEKAEFAII